MYQIWGMDIMKFFVLKQNVKVSYSFITWKAGKQYKNRTFE